MLSPQYMEALERCKQHHAASKTYSGKLLRPHKDYLCDLIERLAIKSALDYGAGKGEQYDWIDPRDGWTLEQAWGFQVRKYDPAWPPFAKEPEGSFDLVICTHVLGSIPQSDLPCIISRLFTLARKAVFIAEKIGPVKKSVLDEGLGVPRNWHAIDWIDAIAPQRKPGVECHLSVRYRSKHGAFTGRFVL